VSVLSGPEIKRLATGGTGPNGERLSITPFGTVPPGPNSIDVHLTDSLRVYDLPGYLSEGRWVSLTPLDPENPPPTVPYPVEPDGRWLLWPGRGYLGSVVERIESHGLVPDIDGRSSCGRYFITLHQTAGRGDDGAGLNWTLELAVTQPVYLRPGSRIAQFTFHTITGERQPYAGRYQGDETPVASRCSLSDRVRETERPVERPDRL
jgi:dCTP deaminase